MNAPSSVCIEQLWVYPVKSLRGISVEQWPITPQGLQYDRQWMLVMPNGRFVSQRQLPQMALIDTQLHNDSLWLSRSGFGAVQIPLVSDSGLNGSNASHSNQQPSQRPAIFSASVWRDECDVKEASRAASAWLTQVLQAPQPLRLVSMAEGTQRPQSQPERFGKHTHTQFADAAPFLVSNKASLDELNGSLQKQGLETVDMRRFRPNIVISGLEAFAEQQLTQLIHYGDRCSQTKQSSQENQTGQISQLQLVDLCERCVVTTINPDTAHKHPQMQPYHTLADLNPIPSTSPKQKAPAFGMNAVWLRCGDQSQNVHNEHPSWSVGDCLESMTG